MKKTLNTNEAAQILADDTNANFSNAGAFALVEYLEELETDTGEETEFDACAIRCDFTEYASLREWAHEHFSNAWDELGLDETDCDDDEFDTAARDYLQDHTTLIEFDGGVVVGCF